MAAVCSSISLLMLALRGKGMSSDAAVSQTSLSDRQCIGLITKRSITKRKRTDLGRSAGAKTVIQQVRLT